MCQSHYPEELGCVSHTTPATTSTGVDRGVARAGTLVTFALQVSSRVSHPRRRLHRDVSVTLPRHLRLASIFFIEKKMRSGIKCVILLRYYFCPLTLTFSVFICLSLGPSVLTIPVFSIYVTSARRGRRHSIYVIIYSQ